MREAERALLASRERRNAARKVLDSRLERVRGAVARRSIPARLADDAFARIRGVTAQANAVLGEYRWLGALAALGAAGWVLRRPLQRLCKATATRLQAGEPQSLWRRLQEWTAGKVKP